jgi:hypothetical protein
MATLPTRGGKLLFNNSKLLSKCGCCCACKSPWCCNAPAEVYATLSLAAGRRQWQQTFGSGSTAYTITLDFDFASPEGIYTIPDGSGSNPCGINYNNISQTLVANDPSSWVEFPQIFLGYQATTPATVVVAVNFYFASGQANYRRTGYLPGEELSRPFYLLFRKVVPAQPSVAPLYGCQNWSALGVVDLLGGIAPYQAPQFNFYNGFVGQPPYPDWYPPLDLEVSFDV